MMRTSFRLVKDIAPAPTPNTSGVRVGYDAAAFGASGPSGTLLAQYPQLTFSPLAAGLATPALAGCDLLILTADAARPKEVGDLINGLRESRAASRVIVFVANADVETTRRLTREGVGEVLPAPVTEPALAASLDRVLARTETAGGAGKGGQIMTFIKAGGGSGATALAVQTAAVIADGGRGPRVCVVDLDVQFGQAALYLDVQDAITMAQVLSATGDLSELAFSSALNPHASGARVLAAPPEFMPLEALTPGLVDSLIAALRREFEVIILDLPSAWTAWTYRALRQSDRIVLITQLSVPHAHLARRQIHLLETQRLDDIALTLVCNRCGDNPTGVSQRSVEAAIGRSFDVVAPEDRKLMNEAINQGLAISALRRGSKLEKALQQIADRVAPERAAHIRSRGR